MNLVQLLKHNPMQKSMYVSGINGYKLINKLVSRSAVTATSHAQPENQNDPIKPFKDMPGPKGLPFVGSLWDLYKNKGYYYNRSHELFTFYSQQYGSIYKCRIGSVNMVYVSTPEDATKVFQAEGQYANRGKMLPMVVYREQSKKPKGVLIG